MRGRGGGGGRREDAEITRGVEGGGGEEVTLARPHRERRGGEE